MLQLNDHLGIESGDTVQCMVGQHEVLESQAGIWQPVEGTKDDETGETLYVYTCPEHQDAATKARVQLTLAKSNGHA